MNPASSLDHAFDTAASKRRYVRRLFTTIADRYDLITGVLSYGQDRRWKARLVREARIAPSDVALDLACGTGDIAIAMSGAGAARVVGLDITHRMLELAAAKRSAVVFLTGDMGALPMAARSVDLVTTGYGLRNVPDLNVAIAEIARVLRPSGRFLSLDFNRPDPPVIRWLYLTYLSAVGGALGWILHGDPDTYRYIPESIRRYPGAAGVAEGLRAAGFTEVRIIPLLLGLMSLHIARR